MARERDDDYQDEDYEDRPRRRRRDDDGDEVGNPRRGREKLKNPGLFLAIAGGLSLVISVLVLAVSIVKPSAFTDPMIDFAIDMIEKQPANPQNPQAKQQQIDELKRKKAEGQAVNPVNVAGGVLAVVLNAVTLLGGLKMRGANGYGLSLAGAICGIVPIHSCCCLTLPAGIWALVAILNADSKAAFAANKPGAVRRDPLDDDNY